MKNLKDLFEKLVDYFTIQKPQKEAAEEVELTEEQAKSGLSRSGKTKKKPLSQHPIRRFWRRFHLTKILLILGLTFGLVVGGYLFYVAKTTNVKDLQNALKATTLIFDKDGNEAGSLSGQKGTYVELTEISQDLQNAVIATEDRTFYENGGINYSRFILAILTAGR